MSAIGLLILLAASSGAELALLWFLRCRVYLFGCDLRGPNGDLRLRRTAGQPFRHRWECGPFVVYRDR